MLDLKIDRPDAPDPKDAATLLLVREGDRGIELFCVERNKASRFMGGALVFPGGKLDADDGLADWDRLSTPPREPHASTIAFANDASHLRALAVAACRETLEEAAILPVVRAAHTASAGGAIVEGGAMLCDDELGALRARMKAAPSALRAFLGERGLRLDLGSLHPFQRWITPEAESRRYDARFFVTIAPAGQAGAHDDHETMASFWARPADVLARYEKHEVQLAPPTHRIFTLLATCGDTGAVLALAAASCLDPICPRLVQQADGEGGQTLALALPGDPEHDVKEARVRGGSRYVLRGGRWNAEDAPR